MGPLSSLLTIAAGNLIKSLIYHFFFLFTDTALHVWKMMLSRQEMFLLFLAYNFVGLKCDASNETTGRFFSISSVTQHRFTSYTLRYKIKAIVHIGIVKVAKHVEIPSN